MRIAICDDEPKDIKAIREHVSAHPLPHEVIEFTSPEPFLRRAYGGEHFDLLFLDVQMPGADGWEIAKELKQSKVKLFIAMVTVMGEYISDCFDRVDWFAEKPVSIEKIHKVIDFAYGELYPKAFEFQTDMTTVSLTAPEIIYIKATGKDILIHTATRVYKHRQSLTKFENLLAHIPCFARIYQSFIINLSFLDEINGNDAILKTGEALPISRHYRKSFFVALERYIRSSQL
jgi:two-component system LytT family response regulator